MSLFRAELKGRDLIEIEISDGDASQRPRVKVIGCTELLSLVRKFQVQFGRNPLSWPLPQGVSHSELLLKEVLLKTKGQWTFPCSDAEICHCRGVPTEVVDQAIVSGAHHTQAVSRQTSASTNCGTCKTEVQKIIDFRLKASS